MRRIGVLVALIENNPEGQVRVQAFRQELEGLGWVDGRNVRIDFRWPGGNAERLRTSAVELVNLRPDVIFAGNTTALSAMQKAAGALPIVFAQVADPVARGFVASLARPGLNITGFANHEHAIAAKWVELLAEVAPHVTRVGVIYDPINDAQKFQPEIERAISPSIKLAFNATRSRTELDQAIKQIGAEPNGALIILSGPLTALHSDLITSLAVKYRLPLVHPYRYFTVAGGLMSYGPDIVDEYRRAAATWIASSKAKSLPICRFNFRPNTSLLSTSRPRQHSASPCRRSYSLAPTR